MAAESDVLSEVEVLQSIYLDELSVNQRDEGGWTVSLVLYPSTAEDCLSQFVRLTLTMDLDCQYPYSSPCISIHNPRGLSDDKLLSLLRSLQIEAQSCIGTPVLYQLIERAKEILTESNIPHGNCVICLYGFKEGEVFTKTSCYHYFHSHCLGRYITHSEMELKDRERELEEDKTRDRTEEEDLAVVCPVCREPLTYDLDALLSSPAPVFTQAPANVSGAESSQSLLSSSQDSTGATQASQSHHITGQSQHPCSERRQQGDFKRGRRGRGGSACHTMPTPAVERLGRPVHSSDKINYVNSGPPNTTPQRESTAQGQGCELSDKITQLRQPLTNEEEKPVSQEKVTSESNCKQDVSQQKVCISKDVTQTILQEGHQEREHVGRGWKRGGRGSGRHHGHWQERNFKGPSHWDNSENAGHHGGGHRAREGGAGHHLRGGGAHRGGGRGLHQRVEKEFRKEGVL
ncbi:E3 ubiquitin-protein ligase RNF25-like isoform X2 [Sinocyclocheilus anshuiensis]|uniref:E3 ubiquitin-protein ligase RNF25-like isoform X2 n=1 Tax=Sinocyclocheilus anshuiensis TaxID=1608454 RepID=UPI0007BA240B|nr:PREDICTED: E3 ubiquitin-protein ligase RNF25-like isoform X2 [Sinocyclocheilus anshuiensis]